MPVSKPTKPFKAYAWHWASVQPTEGLLVPPVYFGVLRAIRKWEGEPKSSPNIRDALSQVEDDTVGIRSKNLQLARDPERNLFRNSGQYWQALGLLQDLPGELQLTNLGRQVADGEIPVDDFVAATVRGLKLPNPRIQKPRSVIEWEKAGVAIKPLTLILQILLALPRDSAGFSFITANELWRIIIPLAGVGSSVKSHVEAIVNHRSGKLNISAWPDCTPGANDPRSALEFALFLSYNGLLTLDRVSKRKSEWRFVLEPPQRDLAHVILDTIPSEESIETASGRATDEQISVQVARVRRLVEQIARPDQAKFRRGCFEDHGQRCVLTSETTKEVLIAAHVMPVKYDGADLSENGLPLRADIHLLFDAGLIKIYPDGQVELHQSLDSSPTYSSLPSNITLPAKLNPKNLEWRLKYM
jgi:hypothetical protein